MRLNVPMSYMYVRSRLNVSVSYVRLPLNYSASYVRLRLNVSVSASSSELTRLKSGMTRSS